MRFPRFNRILGWPAGLVIGLALLSLSFGLWIHSRIQPPPTIDLSTITLVTPSHEKVRLDALGGQRLVINFWATWCPPCLEELPVISKFSENPDNSAFRVVGIALDDPQAVDAFLKAHPLPYPVLIDGTGATDGLSSEIGNREGVLPFTALLDQSGQLLATHRGGFDAEGLNRFVRDQRR